MILTTFITMSIGLGSQPKIFPKLKNLLQIDIHWFDPILLPLGDEPDDLQETDEEPEVQHKKKVLSH